MKTPIRLLAACALVLACSAPARAQKAEAQSASQPWMQFEKELGLQSVYSVDMVMQSMGMNMTAHLVRDNG